MTSQGPAAETENPINYYTFDLAAEECRGWKNGERTCTSAVVDVSVTLENIQKCRPPPTTTN